MRLVLDTNVMVSALLWHGSPSKVFRMGLEEGHSFFTSPRLLAEFTKVLLRPKLHLQIAKSQLSIAELIDAYSESTTSVIEGNRCQLNRGTLTAHPTSASTSAR
jgi:putative PIN family toxin of toxin-antitoxin system